MPVQQLALAMTVIGIFTTLTSYSIYRFGLLPRLGGLRWTLLLITLLTALQMLLNVWIMARLMFVDNQFITLTGLMVVYAGLSAIAFSYFVSRVITERLQAIGNATRQVAEGDLSTRIVVTGNDEISHLAANFNAMATELETAEMQKQRLEKMRRDLVAWVSHDLRTPLASLRVMLEALADGVIRDEETFSRYLKASLGETQHLSHLIDDLFDLAQLDVGHLHLDLQPMALADLISDTISSMSAKAAHKGLHLTGSAAPDVGMVQVAPDKIQRVLYNLVNNAILYTPAGETITITAERIPNGHCVRVHNSGVYIPPETLSRVFESFYRGEAARTATPSGERGTGLGLAIARGFIEAHQGTIRAESSPHGGTTFLFSLPHGK
jgi:signal transduction histidine kinase